MSSSYDLVYIDNCPLWRMFIRLLSWLLMRLLPLYILIRKYKFLLQLLFIPWKFMPFDMFECISSETASALNCISPSLRSEDHTCSETKQQRTTPSAMLTWLSIKLKAFLFFFSPVTPSCCQGLPVPVKRNSCHWLKWSVGFSSEVFRTTYVFCFEPKIMKERTTQPVLLFWGQEYNSILCKLAGEEN